MGSASNHSRLTWSTEKVEEPAGSSTSQARRAKGGDFFALLMGSEVDRCLHAEGARPIEFALVAQHTGIVERTVVVHGRHAVGVRAAIDTHSRIPPWSGNRAAPSWRPRTFDGSAAVFCYLFPDRRQQWD